MRYLKQTWEYLLVEPFLWIFYLIFQPSRFKREVEKQRFLDRVLPALRLALFISLLHIVTFIPQLLSSSSRIWSLFLVSVFFFSSVAGGITGCIAVGIFVAVFPPEFTFLNHSLLGIPLKISNAGIPLDTATFAIVGSAAILENIGFGILWGVMWKFAQHLEKAFATGPTNTIILSIEKRTVRILGKKREVVARSIAKGIVISAALGGWLGIVSIIFQYDFILYVLGFSMMWALLESTDKNIWLNTYDEDFREDDFWKVGFGWGIGLSVVWDVALILSFLLFRPLYPLNWDILLNFVALAPIEIFFYSISYFRLFSSTFSYISFSVTYFFCRRKPSRVFTYLHRSALYWDEGPFFLFPSLGATLLIAVEQNVERAFDEVSFIVHERPHQAGAIPGALSEIALRAPELMLKNIRIILPSGSQLYRFRGALSEALYKIALYAPGQTLETIHAISDETPEYFLLMIKAFAEIFISTLEQCNSLLDLAQVSQRLDELLRGRIEISSELLNVLNCASSEAARYFNRRDWQGRRDALESLLVHLKSIDFTGFENEDNDKRLTKVVNEWQILANGRLKELSKAPEITVHIINPYKAGPELKLNDPSFVGRHDLVQRLEWALSGEDNHPAFYLNGEVRMGKSSTLLQLPKLLSTRYLPVFFDMQQPGIFSNIASFFEHLTIEIYEAMNRRGMMIDQLRVEVLKDALKENEPAVYGPVDKWLDEVQSMLKQKNCILLLTLDEFEMLEEMGQVYFNLSYLLGWFRNLIQHRSQITLIFSGVRRIEELGTKTGVNWGRYFVNVQTHKVSFLKRDEAIQLITQPTAKDDFPSDDVFGEGVVDKIIGETGYHPFLIQAVCSELVDILNMEDRKHAGVQDVEAAVDQVLERWENGYFLDLWQRTDEDQRRCLDVVRKLGKAEVYYIKQYSGLDEEIVDRTIQNLCKRDLLLSDSHGTYRIASPIFHKWVEQAYISSL